MNLHVFSLPGHPGLKCVVDASRPYLTATDNPLVLYLPAAAGELNRKHVTWTHEAFADLARVEVMDLSQSLETDDLIKRINEANVLYIPGGNTYLLLWRMQQAGILEVIKQRLKHDMALVGFSAGALICGPNILTSTADNVCEGTDFSGFDLTQYNFSAHYPAEESEDRDERDAQIKDYHTTYTNPVLALEDDAGVTIDDNGARVDFGHCWLFEAGKHKVLLPVGKIG